MVSDHNVKLIFIGIVSSLLDIVSDSLISLYLYNAWRNNIPSDFSYYLRKSYVFGVFFGIVSVILVMVLTLYLLKTVTSSQLVQFRQNKLNTIGLFLIGLAIPIIIIYITSPLFFNISDLNFDNKISLQLFLFFIYDNYLFVSEIIFEADITLLFLVLALLTDLLIFISSFIIYFGAYHFVLSSLSSQSKGPVDFIRLFSLIVVLGMIIFMVDIIFHSLTRPIIYFALDFFSFSFSSIIVISLILSVMNLIAIVIGVLLAQFTISSAVRDMLNSSSQTKLMVIFLIPLVMQIAYFLTLLLPVPDPSSEFFYHFFQAYTFYIPAFSEDYSIPIILVLEYLYLLFQSLLYVFPIFFIIDRGAFLEAGDIELYQSPDEQLSGSEESSVNLSTSSDELSSDN